MGDGILRPKKGSAYFMFVGAMVIYGTIGIFREFIPLSSGLLAFSRGLLTVC